jgi:hypothetical protein
MRPAPANYTANWGQSDVAGLFQMKRIFTNWIFCVLDKEKKRNGLKIMEKCQMFHKLAG